MDETTDLFDSYDIHTSADQIGGCQFVSYDKDTKKVTYLITVQHMDGKKIKGERLRFSLGKILAKKNNWEDVLSDVSLQDVQEVNKVMSEKQVDIRGGWGDYEDREL